VGNLPCSRRLLVASGSWCRNCFANCYDANLVFTNFCAVVKMSGNEFDSRAPDLLSLYCRRGMSSLTRFGKEEYQNESYPVGSCPTPISQWARSCAEIDAVGRELVLRTTGQRVRSTELRCSLAAKCDRAFP
jgi:hypothetical protein